MLEANRNLSCNQPVVEVEITKYDKLKFIDNDFVRNDLSSKYVINFKNTFSRMQSFIIIMFMCL